MSNKIANCVSKLINFSNTLIDKYYDTDDVYAIVFDIDDTIIETSVNKVTRVEITETLPMMHNVYKKFLTTLNYKGKHMFKVFFVTARSESYRDQTIETLRNHDFSEYEYLYMRPPILDKRNLDETDCVCYFKERARMDIETAKGYKILLSIGDQYTDFIGGYFIYSWKLPQNYDGSCLHVDPKRYDRIR